MKKIILAVILLAAAGGITYYLLQKKKQDNPEITINKELVTGNWRVDSLVAKSDSTNDGLALLLFAMDSNAKKQVYNFQPDGKVIASVPGDSTVKRDTSSFTWGKANEFFWKEKMTDAVADSMRVVELNELRFVLRSDDSTLIYLTRVK
jgi:hypothetical protein